VYTVYLSENSVYFLKVVYLHFIIYVQYVGNDHSKNASKVYFQNIL